MLLKDRVAVISGMGPGLGQELARAFVREGARIGICCRNTGFLESIAKECRAAGGEVVAVPADVTDRAQCERLVEETAKAFGKIDTLVNSAYTAGAMTLFEDTDPELWRLPWEVNVLGALHLTQAALPHLKAAGASAVCNVNSMVQKKPLPGQAAYASSKAALAAATKMLAKELGQYGIRVNSVHMGWMWGPPVEQYVTHAAKEAGIDVETMKARIAKDIPLGFIPEDGDCANAVVFLCSDLARVITGAALDCNGGEFMP